SMGEDIPAEIIEQFLPELEARMAGGFDDEIEAENEEFDPFFLPPPRRKSSKKRKPWYQL
ncbi:MAG: hypothetical protein F6J97_23210, partial [Leptolyngbya sp. SIO4C1]|nr:hypothetical protein [Leptolyngbya sp. SIO4C1]